MTAPARFTQSDIARAMKAAKQAGFPHVRVTVDRTGNLIVDVFDQPEVEPVRANPLDRLLYR